MRCRDELPIDECLTINKLRLKHLGEGAGDYPPAARQVEIERVEREILACDLVRRGVAVAGRR